jgi:hypothetical protein
VLFVPHGKRPIQLHEGLQEMFEGAGVKRDRKDHTPVISHNPKLPEGWLSIHRAHGRGPFYEVQIGQWHRWRCTCGDKFHFTDEQRDAEPEKFVI